MVQPLEAAAMLDKLARKLADRQADVEKFDKAYKGEFRLQYASTHFKEFVESRYEGFNDNWCGIVADAPAERLEVTGIRLPNQSDGDKELWDDWRLTDSDAYSDMTFLDAIKCKRGYALVWGVGDNEPSVTWESPAQAIVGYDPETRARRAGAKVWRDENTEYATLYLPDALWKFQRPVARIDIYGADGRPLTAIAGGWVPREGQEQPIPNPMGKVPLVEIPNRPQLVGEPMSDVAGMMAMQDAINLFWTELFSVADEATIGQRIIIGAEQPVMPILNAEGEVVGEKKIDLRKWRKDRVGWLEDPNAKAHEWKPAALDPFTSVIEIMVGHVAAQTRTPAHYLLIGGTMANVSADAMKALETGLVKRTQEKTKHFGRAVRDVFELMALARNEPAKAQSVRSAEVLWKDVENRSDAQLADAALKDRGIGLPLRYILEQRYGHSPAEIDRIMNMVREEASDPVLSRILGKELNQAQESEGGDVAADDAAPVGV